jgi:hypothetical protein
MIPGFSSDSAAVIDREFLRDESTIIYYSYMAPLSVIYLKFFVVVVEVLTLLPHSPHSQIRDDRCALPRQPGNAGSTIWSCRITDPGCSTPLVPVAPVI